MNLLKKLFEEDIIRIGIYIPTSTKIMKTMNLPQKVLFGTAYSEHPNDYYQSSKYLTEEFEEHEDDLKTELMFDHEVIIF